VNTVKPIGRLFAAVGFIALVAGLVLSGGRVNEICVISGEIDYCVPKES